LFTYASWVQNCLSVWYSISLAERFKIGGASKR
jgi:hypothetical protein